jgi:hypothetical protein
LKVKLFGYLGVDDEGKLQLYVSSQKLNVIGARLEKGSKFPHSVYNFVDEPSDHNAALAVKGLQGFLDGKDERAIGLTFGEKPNKKKR